MFEILRSKIVDPSKLIRLPTEECSRLQSRFPALPPDYFEFLKTVGSGDLGTIAIYNFPMEPVEVYGNARAEDLSGIVLFGDDMQGYCYGFDSKDGGRVVEIDPKGNIDRTIEPGFLKFLDSFVR